MENKDLQEASRCASMLFEEGAVQIHSGANVQIGGTQTITQNFYNAEQQRRKPDTDSLAKAIARLQEERDKRGNLLLCDKSAWYAVVRVAIDYFGFPKQLAEACRQIEAMGFEISYESVRQISQRYPPLGKPFKDWNAKQCLRFPAVHQKLHHIATTLLAIAGIDSF